MPSERLTISGELGRAPVAEWVTHRARKLSLEGRIVTDGPAAISVVVAGPEALLDAMEVACLLGPAKALIGQIDREPLETSDFRAILRLIDAQHPVF
jgi:acylphosphatase